MGLKLNVKAAMVALVMSFLLLPGVSHSVTHQYTALVGLKGMTVEVEKVDPQAERLGITKDQMQTDVELRLRKAVVRGLKENLPGSERHFAENEI